MKISIIVPVYNMAADGKLEFCMDSLVHQTIENYEIIAVDDASTDRSYEILQQYQERYPGKVRVIRSPENRRQGGARNLGMDSACGQWIGFMDSDDFAAPDMYEKLLAKAEETGADVVGCQYQMTNGHSFAPGRRMENNTPEQCGILDDRKRASLILQCGSMVVKIYRRDVIERFGLRFPEHTFYEDNYAGPLWMMCFTHFELVDEPLYYYYQHALSTVHTISVEKCRNRMDMALRLVGDCQKRGFYDTYREELESYFTRIYYTNTLFSYVRTAKWPRMSLVRELRDGMNQYFSDFQKNKYYNNAYDEEEKRLIAMHMAHPLRYVIYYKLLRFYRRLRYGQKGE